MLNQFLEIFLSLEFYTAILRMTTPLLLAAMGGLLAERTGIVTFSMEGMMLMGAVAGVIGSGLSGSAWVGLATAIIAGMAIALIFAVMSVTVGANQIVSSVALNIGVVGLSSLLFVMAFKAGDEVIQTTITVQNLSEWKVPILGDIPVIGPIFFNHLPLVYFGFLMVPLVWFILYRTTWGLKIRAVGEHPHAADTLGISVARIRYLTILFAGALSGLAGAFLSVGTLNTFQENMSAGRGFIAYTAIVFGKWEPIGVFLGTLLFGAVDALQLRMQTKALPIPYQLMVALPYIVTLIVLIVFVGKASWPASYGLPFKREGK